MGFEIFVPCVIKDDGTRDVDRRICTGNGSDQKRKREPSVYFTAENNQYHQHHNDRAACNNRPAQRLVDRFIHNRKKTLASIDL
jgi:hypothetical protein